MSVRMDGYEVARLPSTTSASISCHDPWRMAPTGLRAGMRGGPNRGNAEGFPRDLRVYGRAMPFMATLTRLPRSAKLS